MKCSNCGLPVTSGIKFNADTYICQACENFARRKEINWEAREKELKDILDKHRGRKLYDCAIAVSGGKDSHWILDKITSLGMNPLLITVMDRFTHTKAGIHNFNNLLKKHNNMMYTINMDLFVQSTRYAFETLGMPLKLTEYYIYMLPYQICRKLGIDLLFYGENSTYEYGGSDTDTGIANGQIYNLVKQMKSEREWWRKGGIEIDPFPIADNLLVLYMSYFYPWSSIEHLKVAKKMGFQTLEGEWDREGCCEDYEQIDSYGYVMHLWMRYPRLGYQRVTDIATRRVREGVWTLEQAQKVIKEKDSILDWRAHIDFRDTLRYDLGDLFEIITSASWNKYYNKEI